MAKPFSIQSPEDIAKEYAGNKQRIAQAMQLGVVDPTAGVLAGMFIDRMRSAQMQEQAPQATVAQQVMGGAPATPPPPPSGGLGAAPPAAPPMAPMQPPMPAPGGAPVGMADGGLATLPVPDAMFDEPTNGGFDDGYAGGGLVAFADGGSAGGWGDYIEEMARKVYPNLQVAGRSRTAARNAEVGGVSDSFHLIDAARDLTTPPGMSKAEFIAQLRSVFGPEYDILPSKGNSVHVEPGPALGKQVRAGTAKRTGLEQEYATDNPLEVPAAPSLMGIIDQLGGYAGQRGGEKTRAYLEAAQLSPERREEMKRMNEAAALAAAAEAFGTQGPFLSQLGTAAAKAAGVLGEGKRGLREAELEGLKAGMTDEQQAYLDRMAMLDPAARIYGAAMAPREAALGRRASATAAAEEREWRTNEAAKERAIRRELAKLNVNPSDMETAVAILKDGTPEQKAALTEWLKMKQQYSPSGGGSWEDFGGTGTPSKPTAGPWTQYQQ